MDLAQYVNFSFAQQTAKQVNKHFLSVTEQTLFININFRIKSPVLKQSYIKNYRSSYGWILLRETTVAKHNSRLDCTKMTVVIPQANINTLNTIFITG